MLTGKLGADGQSLYLMLQKSRDRQLYISSVQYGLFRRVERLSGRFS